eukprot:COSAG01_NODE_696_length_14189_cov_31.024769_14_plen_249_part_00
MCVCVCVCVCACVCGGAHTAAAWYRLRPAAEARHRCGLGADAIRHPGAELFRQPRKGGPRPPPPPVAWPAAAAAGGGCSAVAPGGESTPTGLVGRDSQSCDDHPPAHTEEAGGGGGPAAAATQPPASNASSSSSPSSSSPSSPSAAAAAACSSSPKPPDQVEQLSCQMLTLWFSCALLPGAVGTLLLAPGRAKLLRQYEAGEWQKTARPTAAACVGLSAGCWLLAAAAEALSSARRLAKSPLAPQTIH